MLWLFHCYSYRGKQVLFLLQLHNGTLPLGHKSFGGRETSTVREGSEKTIININVIVFMAITVANQYLFDHEKFMARGMSRSPVKFTDSQHSNYMKDSFALFLPFFLDTRSKSTFCVTSAECNSPRTTFLSCLIKL